MLRTVCNIDYRAVINTVPRRCISKLEHIAENTGVFGDYPAVKLEVDVPRNKDDVSILEPKFFVSFVGVYSAPYHNEGDVTRFSTVGSRQSGRLFLLPSLVKSERVCLGSWRKSCGYMSN